MLLQEGGGLGGAGTGCPGRTKTPLGRWLCVLVFLGADLGSLAGGGVSRGSAPRGDCTEPTANRAVELSTVCAEVQTPRQVRNGVHFLSPE